MKTVTSLFSDIADAIREKTGSTDRIAALEMPDRIRGISNINEYQSGIFYTETDIKLNVTEKAYDDCIIIKHGLGRIPTFIFFGIDRDLSVEYVPSSNDYIVSYGINTKKTNAKIIKNQYGSKYLNANGNTQGVTVDSSYTLQLLEGDETNIYVHGINAKDAFIRSGAKYKWIVA